MKAVICDRCKAVVTNGTELQEMNRVEAHCDLVGYMYKKDLCKRCSEELVTWLKGDDKK